MKGLTKPPAEDSSTEIPETFQLTTYASEGEIAISGESTITWSAAEFSETVGADVTWKELVLKAGASTPVVTSGEGAFEGVLSGNAEQFTGELVFKGNVELDTEAFSFEVTFVYEAKQMLFAGSIGELPISGLTYFIWPKIIPPLVFLHIGSCQPIYIDYACLDYFSADISPAELQTACEEKDQYYSRDTLCPVEEILGTCTVIQSGLNGTMTVKEHIYLDSGFDDEDGRGVCDTLEGTWELK